MAVFAVMNISKINTSTHMMSMASKIPLSKLYVKQTANGM